MNRGRRLDSSGVTSRRSAYLSSLLIFGNLALPVAAQVFDHPSNGVATINPEAARKAELANEVADLLPVSAFYETKLPLGPGNPGDLIRSEPASGLQLPLGVSAIRILYRSLSPSGTPVAASGLVLLPAGQAPADGCR